MEGTSGVKKTKEGNSLLWGVFPGGCPVRPPWVCCVGSALGLSAAVGSCLLRTYHTSTTTQQHNPYSNSVFDITVELSIASSMCTVRVGKVVQ